MLKDYLLFNTVGNKKKTWSLAMKFAFPQSGVLLLTYVCILVAATTLLFVSFTASVF